MIEGDRFFWVFIDMGCNNDIPTDHVLLRSDAVEDLCSFVQSVALGVHVHEDVVQHQIWPQLLVTLDLPMNFFPLVEIFHPRTGTKGVGEGYVIGSERPTPPPPFAGVFLKKLSASRNLFWLLRPLITPLLVLTAPTSSPF